jgi:hypothetical protein
LRLGFASRESGGTGRRAGFRNLWVKPWGFESPLSHQIGSQGFPNRDLLERACSAKGEDENPQGGAGVSPATVQCRPRPEAASRGASGRRRVPPFAPNRLSGIPPARPPRARMQCERGGRELSVANAREKRGHEHQQKEGTNRRKGVSDHGEPPGARVEDIRPQVLEELWSSAGFLLAVRLHEFSDSGFFRLKSY